MNQKMLSRLYPILPRLYPILDASVLAGEGVAREQQLQRLGQELLESGVTLLQYRNKSGGEAEVLADARILRDGMPAGKCLLILNDYPRLAVEAQFDGVHLGQGDMPASQGRAILGNDRVLGLSTHNLEQLAAAERSSANYVAIGPVFATSSKQNPDPVVGLEGVKRARMLTTKPLVAIGGITLETCRQVVDAGADSIAVISSLFSDQGGRAPAKVAEDFFAKLR
ncbi:Thiamin-phosphate pyrophosphorylase [Acidisarcina polymorpha]|uniref:Thiamine-phosphate synthase n=1 Tax=Acidisarcina polymorpha TaxID=2211140 RepID=A0A2Z5G6J6_9BACT|nr:thiamine phosphate synthase [Acidisarcina polymorpha]AXC14862.1 Thiamin-phosphate pyrophosphorylase [Acidisarcina polymorpha]